MTSARPLPPPIPGTAVGWATATTTPAPPAEPASNEVPTLPIVAAWSAIAVLTVSLVGSKFLLDAIVEFGWPVAVYVAVLATVGYGPSLWWCWYVSRRWGTGRLGHDIGLTPRFADLGWGPVVWLGAIGAQLAMGAVVLALDIPIANNTDGVDGLSADRTYVWALVISAVIAAPLVEEMVFRGVVLRGLRSRLSVVVAVLLQGVLFGAAHADPVRGVGNIGLVMVLSAVGVAFGVAAVLLRRIGPSIVAHAIFNGAVLALLLTGVTDRLQDVDSALEAFGAVEQVSVVDETNVPDPHGHGDPGVSSAPFDAVE